VHACLFIRQNNYTSKKKSFLCGDECTDFFIITIFCIGVEKLKFKNAWLLKNHAKYKIKIKRLRR